MKDFPPSSGRLAPGDAHNLRPEALWERWRDECLVRRFRVVLLASVLAACSHGPRVYREILGARRAGFGAGSACPGRPAAVKDNSDIEI